VEKYLGGPDAAVERVLSAFQDALACVSPTTRVSHVPPEGTLLAFFTDFFYLYLSPSPYHLSRHQPAFRDDLCRKYRYMDSNLAQRRRGLEEKIPDIKKTLNMVEFLRDRRVRDIHEGCGGDVHPSILSPLNFSLSLVF
jgi:hypothetical protein